jgi:hypothetical protein
MANLPGQRTLILVLSGMLPIDPVGLMAASDLINLATRSKVTISAIDGRGLYTTSLPASAHYVTNSPYPQRWYRDQMQATGFAMADLAAATGGTFFTTATIWRRASRA